MGGDVREHLKTPGPMRIGREWRIAMIGMAKPQGPLQTLRATSPLTDEEIQDAERSRNSSRVTGPG